jgi:hypothetical protein
VSGRLSPAKRRLEQARTRLSRVFGPDQVDALLEYEDALGECREERSGAGQVPEMLTVPEAAELIRAKPQRIYDLFSDGRLTRFGTDHARLVSRAELVAYVENDRGRRIQ